MGVHIAPDHACKPQAIQLFFSCWYRLEALVCIFVLVELVCATREGMNDSNLEVIDGV